MVLKQILIYLTHHISFIIFLFIDRIFSNEGVSSNANARDIKLSMPHLELEKPMMTLGDIDNMGNTAKSQEKDELLQEINSLTKTYTELKSSMKYKSELYKETISTYEVKVSSLKEKNIMLETGIAALTAKLEEKEGMLDELKHVKEEKGKVKALEGENDMLRHRVRTLELQLSEIAFESRKAVLPSSTAVPQASESKESKTVGTAASRSILETKPLTPKAPITPVPPHIYQQRQIEHRQKVIKAVESQLSEGDSRKAKLPSPPAFVTSKNDALKIPSRHVETVAVGTVKHVPKAPTSPVPPHIFQQRQLLEQRQKTMDALETKPLEVGVPKPHHAFTAPQGNDKKSSTEVAVGSYMNDTNNLPKPPSSPVPPHNFHQRQLEQRQRIMSSAPLEMQPKYGGIPFPSSGKPRVDVKKDSCDILPRSRFKIASKSLDTFVASSISDTKHLSKDHQRSVRKLFGQSIRRGTSRVGRALKVWNPVHNLKLWGELWGDNLHEHELQYSQMQVVHYKQRRASAPNLFGGSSPPAFVKETALAATTSATEAAPRPPLPLHIVQQRQLEQLKTKVKEVTEERSSDRPKVFGLGLRRGLGRMGRAMSAWSSARNLGLLGEMRGAQRD